MSFNNPPQYPLREVLSQYDYKLYNPTSKLSDVWLQKEYQKLLIKSGSGNCDSSDAATARESRKRIRNGGGDFGSTEELQKPEDTETDMEIYSSDPDSAVSNSGGLSGQTTSQGSTDGCPQAVAAVLHPPKRRLTEQLSACSDQQSQQVLTSALAVVQPVAILAARPVTQTASATAGVAPAVSFDRPRTPNAFNSPTHTPISYDEDTQGQAQQLPLPSPSASPIQDVKEMPSKWQTQDYLKMPSSQEDLIEMICNLSLYLNDRNQNHLIFRLLQNVNRSLLLTFNCLIQGNLKRDLISNLPLELTNKILSYLDYKTLISLSHTCKNWYKIVNSPALWINLLKADKLITDNDVIEQELADTRELMSEWSTSRTDINLAQILYKKRCIIVNRWMDPTYEPKRITVAGHGSKVVTCLQHDDEKIVTGADDKPINIYSTKTGKLLQVLEGHEGGVWAMKYTGNTLVTGSTDRTVRIWNMKTGRCTHIFRAHTSTIRCLDIMHPTVIGQTVDGEDIVFPEFPLLVTGSRDHNLHVWRLPLASEEEEEGCDLPPFDSSEIDNPFLIAVLSGHTQSVRSVCGHGNIIISGSYDSTVRVWDLLDKGNCKHVLQGHSDRVYSTAMDFKLKTCFSALMDCTINIWNFETGKLLKTLEGHTSLVGLLALVDDVLVTAAADTSLRIWNPHTGENYCKLEGHSAAITCFEHDGLRVVSGSERMLKLWDVKQGKLARDLLTDVTGGIWQVRIDYKRCVAAVQRYREDDVDETFIEILDFSEPPQQNDPMSLDQ